MLAIPFKISPFCIILSTLLVGLNTRKYLFDHTSPAVVVVFSVERRKRADQSVQPYIFVVVFLKP